MGPQTAQSGPEVEFPSEQVDMELPLEHAETEVEAGVTPPGVSGGGKGKPPPGAGLGGDRADRDSAGS